MILSDSGIKLFMKLKLITISNFNPNQLNPNSYDVCLGNWFVPVAANFGKTVFGAPDYLADGRDFYVPNGGTFLGHTKERIGTFKFVIAELRAKSTTRRCGITVCDDAGFGDIGYNNNWTVELTAHLLGKHWPPLTVGRPFAQMVFFVTTPAENQYAGQYNNAITPYSMIPTRYREEWTKLNDKSIFLLRHLNP